jgi:hypothetical protein
MSVMSSGVGGFSDFQSAQTEAPWARRVNADGVPISDRERRIQRLVWLAALMDSSITLPGTNFKFGLDPLLGLVPGIGDAISDAISLYIIYEAWKIGATKAQLAMMIGNVVVDTLVGTVPVLGDVFDFAFKANVRNLAILGIRVNAPKNTRGV